MKRIVLFFVAAGIFLVPAVNGAQLAWAGKNDVLIKVLERKGILTPREAREILEEVERESAKEKEEVKKVVSEVAQQEAELPKWVKKLKVKGDLRLRYQGQERDNADGSEGQTRNRGRFRLRAAVQADVNPQWQVGFGIASGSDDSRSTNQTLDNGFDSPDLRIDFAYAQYTPFKWLKGVGGKFKNPFWQAKDLLWDGDIRPEGLAVKLNHKLSDNLELFFTPAFYIVEESSASSKDPIMWAFQGRVNWKFSENMYLKLAPSYYVTDNFSGSAFPHRGRTTNNLGNTTDGTGNFVFDYNVFAGDIELGCKIPGPVPFLALFGQYVQSDADDAERPAASQLGDDENQGWLVGFKFGHKKVKEPWQWQVKYNYRVLEKDAWPDFLPDSDFYGGSTNVEGSEIEFQLGLHKNLTFGVDYYMSEINEPTAGDGSREEEVLQVDLVLKW